MLFEGPEKKLEIILQKHVPSLRKDKTLIWDDVVKSCGASVVSCKSFPEFDSYVLSESSLFVYDNRMILITCGQTKLYQTAPILIQHWGKDNIAYIFYGRKSLFFPELQLSDFEQEVAEIQKYIPGRSYRLGAANSDHIHAFVGSPDAGRTDVDDFTMELLMMDVDAKCLKPFRFEGQVPDALELRKCTGLDKLYHEDNPVIDDYCFQPCGYSLNASTSKGYFTVHVTPQKKQSYISFETNIREQDYTARVNQLLSLFKPRKAVLVFYYTKHRPVLDVVRVNVRCDEQSTLNSLGYHIHSLLLGR